jgi:hypothetical protein
VPANATASTWSAFVRQFSRCFTAPSYVFFEQLATAWVMCPGRHTITQMWSVIPSISRHRYEAYARFIREGCWEMDELWCQLVRLLVDHWVPQGPITVLLDDTLAKKTGRKIDGAGYWRDAVRSTASYTVTAWGLNFIILALCITAPWGGEPLALPLLVRVHRKDEKDDLSLVKLASTMILQLYRWLPDRAIRVVVDGAYASLAGYDWSPQVHIVSRIRSDAALFDLPPARTGRRGRPRLRGQRLPNPKQMAATLPSSRWSKHLLQLRSAPTERLLFSRLVLWYNAAGSKPLLLVTSRNPDPNSNQPDDFFITTDTQPSACDIACAYDLRWPIEDTNRNVKQFLAAEDPQSWVKLGPERILSLACWLYSATCHWFASGPNHPAAWPDRPWYTSKRTPSFADALACLRRHCWQSRFFDLSGQNPFQPEIIPTLLSVLAQAA